MEYLNSNPATSELDVDQEELDGIIHTLDWDMLQARIDPKEVFSYPTPTQAPQAHPLWVFGVIGIGIGGIKTLLGNLEL